MKFIYILPFIAISFVACNQSNKVEVDAKTYYDVPDFSKQSSDQKIINIKLDTFYIENDIESSYLGHFWIHDNSLYFSDTHFGYVYRIDKDGNVTERHLGKGKGPNEIIGLDNSIPTENGFSFFYGGNNSLYTFNKSWDKTVGGRVNWNIKRSYSEVLENPEPSLPESYEFDSGFENILKPWDKDHVAIAITASHPKFSGYFDSDLYYNYSRILGLINLKTGKIDRFIGRRSPFYLKHINLPIFDHFNYEPIDDNIFVDFWPDKDIYVINKQSGSAIGKFGQSGRDMNVDYQITSTYKEATKKHYEHRKKFGYYRHLKYIPENKMLFRSYYKGEGTKFDGLQIYENYALLGDVDVPKGFEVLGVIDDDIIGTIVNQEQEEFKVFKIEFSYEN